MRYLFLVIYLFLTQLPVQAQQETYLYDMSPYIADSTSTFKACHPTNTFEYFLVNCKYPVSSPRLLEGLKQIYSKPAGNTQSGFITIRFLVNCQGEMGWFHMYQVDNHYQAYQFEPSIPEQLMTFVKTLNQWKIGKWGTYPVDYFAYFTFKIHNGEIENMVP